MKILYSIEDIEAAIDSSLVNPPNDMPWCWITRRGKLLLCGYRGHNSKLYSIFTDSLNPESATHVVDTKLLGLNYEGYFEKHWVKVSRSFISTPTTLTAKQKIAISKIVLAHKNLFFGVDQFFTCYSTSNDILAPKSFVLVLKEDRIKWEVI